MTVCGITAEYNPFHTGHLHHIAETRRSLGENAVIVCVMSGNFVQRGDFAVLDKYARAEMAVRCGADLVVELPLAAALSSAEGFAKGAVQTLHALGCGTVSFGAETADTDLLLQAAELLNSLPMKGESGSPHLSYAARRQEELSKVNKQAAVLLDNPNNTLAVEYCRFLLPLGMRPLAVLRQGAAHDARAPHSGFASASLLRAHLRDGDFAFCAPFLPPPCRAVWNEAVSRGEAPVLLLSQGNYPLKNLHTVLKALPAVLAQYPGAVLRVAGWPPLDKGPLLRPVIDWMFPYQTWCKQLIRRLGLADHVQYTGPLDAAAMRQAYLDADLFLLPSYSENSPNSLGEAMLLGLPCVASAAGGIPDMLQSGVQGMLYGAAGDDATLSAAILQVLALPDHGTALGTAAQIRARVTHDAAKNTAQMIEIYRKVLQREGTL